MPKYIERSVPGANRLTPEELRDISAQSCAIVAGLGVPCVWPHRDVAGDKFHCAQDPRRPQRLSVTAIARHGAAGGFPMGTIAEIVAIIGLQAATA